MPKFARFTQYLCSGIAIFFLAWALFTVVVTPRLNVVSSYFRMANPNEIISDNRWALMISVVILLLIFILRHHSWNLPTLASKPAYGILLGELVIYFLILALFLKWSGYFHTVDDAQVIYQWALHPHQADPWTDPSWGNHYMYANPQNLLLYFLFRGAISLFGPSFQPIIVIFCLIQAGTTLILFDTLRRLGKSNWTALLMIQLFLAMIQISLQAPIAYTDTLSLIFLALALDFLTIAAQRTHAAHQIGYLSAASLAVLLAYLGKGTSLILVIALVLYLFVSQVGKKKWLTLIPLLVFVVGNAAWSQVIQSSRIYPDTGYGQPNTHYLMMGLSKTPIPKGLTKNQALAWEAGTYYQPDQAYSWKLFYSERLSKSQVTHKQLNRFRIRLTRLSRSQLIRVLNNKVSVVWSSGDLKTSFSLVRGMHDQKRGQRFFSSGTPAKFLYFLMTVSQILLYLVTAIGLFKSFRNPNPIALIGSIYLSGYFIFMLLWEANPRYATAIVPACILIGALALSRQVPDSPRKNSQSLANPSANL